MDDARRILEQMPGIPRLEAMDDKPARTRTLSPTKAGMIYGKFVASPVGHIKVRKVGGEVVNVPMNNKERRKLARRMCNGK